MGAPVQKLEEIAHKIFGPEYKKVLDWVIERKEADPHHALPKGKTANVYVIIEPLTRLIIRHEQEPTDLTVIPSRHGVPVPAIMNTKFQSGTVRRKLLSMLHEWYDRHKEVARSELGINDYTCTMRPYARTKTKRKTESVQAGNKVPEGFEGYCKKCPNCLIFGYAVQEGSGYNVKSRVEGDLYVAVIPEEKATVEVTFNAIDDISKTTYRVDAPEESKTGALYTHRMVEVGVPFVGKVALKDMTLAELLLTLVTIARVERIGGRKTHHGRIKVHIPAILFSNYEIGSGYEIANIILSKYPEKNPTIEDVINEVSEYVKKYADQGVLILDRELAEKLRRLTREEVDTIILHAWKDVKILKESLNLFTNVEDK